MGIALMLHQVQTPEALFARSEPKTGVNQVRIQIHPTYIAHGLLSKPRASNC